MRVVNLTVTPCAGAPWDLHTAINDYMDGWSSKIFQEIDTYRDGRSFGKRRSLDSEEAREAIKAADAIILHNNGPCAPWGIGEPERILPDSDVPIVWLLHSPYWQWSSWSWGRMRSFIPATWAGLHSLTWDQAMPIPTNMVQQVVRWDSQIRVKDHAEHVLPVVSYAPSSKKFIESFSSKGYSLVNHVLGRLADSGLIKYEMIYGQSHNDCLTKIEDSDLCIDDLVTGGYHRVFLESCYLGTCAITGMSRVVVDEISRVSGCFPGDVPGIKMKPRWFAESFHKIVNMRELVAGYGQKGRAFIEKYWDPEKIVNEQFRPLIERAGTVTTARIP